jgi:salicylate hydroxylase
MPKQALIAGGGIGGLAAAIALGRRDIACEVLERSDFADESGAGIQLGPNATRALDALGVLDAIQPFSFTPEAIVVRDGVSGRNLTRLALGSTAAERYGALYLTLRRADLHAALRARAADLACVSVRSGFELAAIDTQGRDVVARAADNSEAKGACLIGADGMWSAVRRIVSPAARLRFAGASAWRTQLPRDDLPAPFAEPVVGLWLGPRAHLVHYPVGGGSELNIVAVIAGGAAAQGFAQSSSAAALRESFARWTKDAKSLLDRAHGWRCWSLYRLTRLKHWSTGAVTLLGDAAHPVLPYLAQGAALAIEDAVTLAACIADACVAGGPGDLAPAFRRYERLRRPRATRVQRAARRFGFAYHLDAPLAQARNLLLTRRNEASALSRFDWLYRP